MKQIKELLQTPGTFTSKEWPEEGRVSDLVATNTQKWSLTSLDPPFPVQLPDEITAPT